MIKKICIMTEPIGWYMENIDVKMAIIIEKRI
jgi:hypothetical protein